jgi:small subunit ribosomal protein S8
MSLSDPIADMLVRMRNGYKAGIVHVDVPHSKMKGELARIFKREGFIVDYVVESSAKKVLRIYLKYDAKQEPAVCGLKQISKPGLRKYVGADSVPKVLRGMGIAILSTSSGMMTDREARVKKIGGEVICTAW